MLLLGRRRALPHRRAGRGQPVRGQPGAVAQPHAGGDPARRGLRVVGAARAQPDDRARPAREPPVPQREHRDAAASRPAPSAACCCSRSCSPTSGATSRSRRGSRCCPCRSAACSCGRSWVAPRTRAPPGEIAKPALIAMAIGMLWVSFLPSTASDAWTYLRILPGLALIGVGMGIGFPALNVGRDGRGGRPRGGARLGRAQHGAPARRGDRHGAPRGHVRRAPSTRTCPGSPTSGSRTPWTNGRSPGRWRAR